MSKFELVLFSTDIPLIQQAVNVGVDAIIIDWEQKNKAARQVNANTQISSDTVEDLNRVCANTSAKVICRLNSFNETTNDEIESAITAGVSEILLPMVRTVVEVEKVLEQVANRCGVGILIETIDAIKIAKELAKLPLSRVYVGLNDLAIDRNMPSIFTAIADGTVECLRQEFTASFGFAGLTLPTRGYPIPCHLLIGELIRLNCQFSFLRRSFHTDAKDCGLASMVTQLRQAIEGAKQRNQILVEQQRQQLYNAIKTSIANGEGLLYSNAVK